MMPRIDHKYIARKSLLLANDAERVSEPLIDENKKPEDPVLWLFRLESAGE
jgi:hypothetical protein